MAEHEDNLLSRKIVSIFAENQNEWLSKDALVHKLLALGQDSEASINKNISSVLKGMVTNEEHDSVYERNDNENNRYQKGDLRPQLFTREKNDYRLSDKYYKIVKNQRR
ncbi:hypothetical protein ACYATO_06290 [Lactobacillaceae bacterium Melli_B3]